MKEIKENSCRRRRSCALELLGRCPTEPVLTARADKNAALDFSPNKVNDNPHPTLERIKDIALHHQDELCLGLLSQKHMESYSSPACGSGGPLSQKEMVECPGRVFFSMCKASASALCGAKQV